MEITRDCDPYHMSKLMLIMSDMRMNPVYMEFTREEQGILQVQRDHLTNDLCAYYYKTAIIADAHTCYMNSFEAPLNATLIEYFNCFIVFTLNNRLMVYKAPGMTIELDVKCANKVKSVYDFKTKKHFINEVNGQNISTIYELDLFGDTPKCTPVDRCFILRNKIDACKFNCVPDIAIGSLHGGGIGYSQYCASCSQIEVRNLDSTCIYSEKKDNIQGQLVALNERGIIFNNIAGSSIPITVVKYY